MIPIYTTDEVPASRGAHAIVGLKVSSYSDSVTGARHTLVGTAVTLLNGVPR
ncbi:hypothetical protein [Actinomadura napierensis]|uniref:Uncharacterized protein n=1 Tax=Actinomadura napierensis TaxID=267854 RepID=A0ABN2Z9M1_9ACTN